MRNLSYKDMAYIPNVKAFVTHNLGADPILIKYGIEKAQRLTHIEVGENAKANKYLERQYKRLFRARNNTPKFEAISRLIIQRSDAYMLACLHKTPTLRTWYKDRAWYEVRRILNQVNQIRRRLSYDIAYKRVFIPKAQAGEYRPLGVPTPAWRIYARMLYEPTKIQFDGMRSPRQHGFLPHRGTATAWKYIIRYVIPRMNIWEFDLRKFFDSVHIGHVNQIYKAIGASNQFTSWMTKMLMTKPTLKAKDEEREYKRVMSIKGITNSPRLMASKTLGLQIKAMYGLPQGLGLSPYLSTLTIDHLLEKDSGVIMYADDGIIYASTKEKLQERIAKFVRGLKSLGIEVASDKSSMVKIDGNWLKPLKFLGCQYDGKTGILRAATRSGKTMEMKWRSHPAFAGSEVIVEGKTYKIEEVLQHNSYYMKYLPTLLARIWGGETEAVKARAVRRNSYCVLRGLNEYEEITLSTKSYTELLAEMERWRVTPISKGYAKERQQNNRKEGTLVRRIRGKNQRL